MTYFEHDDMIVKDYIDVDGEIEIIIIEVYDGRGISNIDKENSIRLIKHLQSVFKISPDIENDVPKGSEIC